jgi:hypothetical protein
VYECEPNGSKPVTFGSDRQGINSPESGRWIRYQDVVFLGFDGQRVTRLTSIDQDTFSGYGALYAREKPLVAGFQYFSDFVGMGETGLRPQGSSAFRVPSSGFRAALVQSDLRFPMRLPKK